MINVDPMRPRHAICGLGFGIATDGDFAGTPLASEELAACAGMSPARRREFCMGRAAGHRALADAGAPDGPIQPTGRAPRFPQGFIGSLSHSRGIAVAVAASTRDYALVGIDLELGALAAEAERLVLRAEELEWFRCGAHSCVEVFSAKEAVHKAFDAAVALGTTPLRRIHLVPANGGFEVCWPALGNGPAFVKVHRVGDGALSWLAVPASTDGRHHGA